MCSDTLYCWLLAILFKKSHSYWLESLYYYTFTVLAIHLLLCTYHNSSLTTFGVSSTILNMLSQNAIRSGKKLFLIVSFSLMSTYLKLFGSMTGHKMLFSSGVSCGVGSLEP